jgi:hypothetical protein
VKDNARSDGKPKYRSPEIVDLARATRSFGQGGTVGGTNPCMNGNSPLNACGVGGSPVITQGSCKYGGSANGSCMVGIGAGGACSQGVAAQM